MILHLPQLQGRWLTVRAESNVVHTGVPGAGVHIVVVDASGTVAEILLYHGAAGAVEDADVHRGIFTALVADGHIVDGRVAADDAHAHVVHPAAFTNAYPIGGDYWGDEDIDRKAPSLCNGMPCIIIPKFPATIINYKASRIG